MHTLPTAWRTAKTKGSDTEPLLLSEIDFDTFEDYCQVKWSIERRRAYQLIDAALVVENVKNFTQTPKESSARELERLPAYQLIEAARTVEVMSTKVDIDPPASERQARPLAKLPKEERTDAWQEAVSTAPNGKPTAAHFEKIVAVSEAAENLEPIGSKH